MTTEDQTSQQRPRRTGLIAAAVACAVVVLGTAGTIVVLALSGPDPTDPLSRLDDCKAQAKAKTTVIRFVDDPIVQPANVSATIVGLYDTVNSAGQPTRGVYRCKVAQDSAGNYQLIQVTVSW